MKIESGISNAGFFLLIILVVTLALVYFIYQFKKDKDEFTPTQRTTLSIVRLLYTFIAAVLLLSPLTEVIKTRLEKPILVVGIDNSQSILSDKTDSAEVVSVKNELYATFNNKYDLQLLTFGEKVDQNKEPDFSERTSNYAVLLNEIDKRYYNLNVGAVVLLGDGIYNEGENPVQLTKQISAPIYTIGFGDTLTVVDQAIINVSHNKNVFLKNTFPVEIEGNFTNYRYPKATVQLYVGSQLTWSEEINVLQPDFYFNKVINVKAEEPGLQNITVQMVPFDGEQNTSNNYYRFSIEVHENKHNVLFLTEGPHPDIGAITLTLDKQPNFQVTVANPNNTINNLNDYDLIVLNQLPSFNFQKAEFFSNLISGDKSVLMLIGPNSSLSAINNLGFGITLTPTTSSQESYPFFNESYPVFALSPSLQNVSAVYPPLICYFTDYQLTGDYSVIAYQKINGIEMNYPLMATGLSNNRKIGAIFGEGIWRWRMTEFQNFENQIVFDQLIVNLFNYLCIKETREQFTVTYDRITPETTPVRIKARVNDELFEPIPNAEVRLLLTDSTQAELSYLFDANEATYNLNLGYLVPGQYNFVASTIIGEKEFKKEGSFMVEEINIEQQNKKANHKLLYTLSENTGGKFFNKQNWKEILTAFDQNSNIQTKYHKEKNIYEIIDWKAYFFIIFLLLSLEWFLRKFWGSY